MQNASRDYTCIHSNQLQLYMLCVVRGHLQTDFSTLNVIMMLTFEPPLPPPLTSHTLKQCIDTEIMVFIKTHHICK